MKNIFLFLSLFATCSLFAAAGDTIRVMAHNNVKMITDPAAGYKAYDAWAVFPSSETSYRRASLWITYRCPDSLRCGEWDYIDNVYMKRVGGKTGKNMNTEIARMITPYGWRFNSDWYFTWHVDVSNFSSFLHDSVEISFVHTGYESNTDRGWNVSLQFMMLEGPAPANFIKMDTLWNGSLPYGDSLNSIEKYLHPFKLQAPVDAAFAQLRIIQTGHGMDDVENCAEFCTKYRDIKLDNVLMDHKDVWRHCGMNPLYPQAGTWIFDRAGWCPGSAVYPDVYTFGISSGKPHVWDIDMQNYVNRSKPTANYFFSSQLFYYQLPAALNDVALEEILQPSNSLEQSRHEPSCNQPVIRVRNNGSSVLSKLTILYGIKGEKPLVYNWQGKINPLNSADIELNLSYPESKTASLFYVELSMPNGMKDEWPKDNTASSQVRPQTNYKGPLILQIHTNKDTLQNAYTIKDASGNVVKSRNFRELAPSTLYRDTLNFPEGCYTFQMIDTMGDGMDFWFNVNGGYGTVRLTDINGKLLRSFNSDFGSEIFHAFRFSNTAVNKRFATDTLPVMNVFPIRNPGKFDVDLYFDSVQPDVNLEVKTMEGKLIYSQLLSSFKEGLIPVDISLQPDAFYLLSVRARDGQASRKIKVKKSL